MAISKFILLHEDMLALLLGPTIREKPWFWSRNKAIGYLSLIPRSCGNEAIAILACPLPPPGFLSGLATLSHLPETFQRDMSPRIRPHIQKSYMCTDPFSPLTLVVPQGLSPPWRDCFVEGQKDVIHGGMLMKTVVLNARLKQCSRCV